MGLRLPETKGVQRKRGVSGNPLGLGNTIKQQQTYLPKGWGYDRFYVFALAKKMSVFIESKITQNIPLEHAPHIPKPLNERNSFINCWLGMWGMFQ